MCVSIYVSLTNLPSVFPSFQHRRSVVWMPFASLCARLCLLATTSTSMCSASSDTARSATRCCVLCVVLCVCPQCVSTMCVNNVCQQCVSTMCVCETSAQHVCITMCVYSYGTALLLCADLQRSASCDVEAWRCIPAGGVWQACWYVMVCNRDDE